MHRHFYWYKFQLNFISMFYLSLLESLVLYAEFPALESPSLSGTSSTTVCQVSCICSRQAEEKEIFHASPKGSCVLKYMGMRKWKKYTFCNTSEKFCHVSEPGIPVKFHPFSRPWIPRQSQLLA